MSPRDFAVEALPDLFDTPGRTAQWFDPIRAGIPLQLGG